MTITFAPGLYGAPYLTCDCYQFAHSGNTYGELEIEFRLPPDQTVKWTNPRGDEPTGRDAIPSFSHWPLSACIARGLEPDCDDPPGTSRNDIARAMAHVLNGRKDIPVPFGAPSWDAEIVQRVAADQPLDANGEPVPLTVGLPPVQP